MELRMKTAIITFHNTPNYGATLQCYALSSFLKSEGLDVEVVNYMPPHNLLQYAKSLFGGKRRSLRNIERVIKFYKFVRKNLQMSGNPVFRQRGLSSLARRYDLAFTGSDEVWKVDHMRKFDPTYYLNFCDIDHTRVYSYAASASTVTDLREYATDVIPLLNRFSDFAIRDPSTAGMVQDLTGRPTFEVVDPTLLWDFGSEALSRIITEPYIALYSWLDDTSMSNVMKFASLNGLKVVSIGCINKGSHENLIGIGPTEWMSLIKYSSCVVTDFFHGIVFSLIFKRPFYAHVDSKKRMKLEHILKIAGVDKPLYSDTRQLLNLSLEDISPDWEAVGRSLGPRQEASKRWLREKIYETGQHRKEEKLASTRD